MSFLCAKKKCRLVLKCCHRNPFLDNPDSLSSNYHPSGELPLQGRDFLLPRRVAVSTIPTIAKGEEKRSGSFGFFSRRKTTSRQSGTIFVARKKFSLGKRRNHRRKRGQPMRRRQATGESDRTNQPKERTPKRNLWTSLLLVAHQRQEGKEHN